MNIIRKLSGIVLAVLLLAAACTSAFANGPIAAVGTTPRTYPASAFTLTYKVDQGGLGSLTNAIATSIADYAFQVWDTLSTGSLAFSNGGQLARNVISASDAYISGSSQYTDGVNPIVFDSSGAITDGQLGSGASNYVLGYAGSSYIGNNYVEGYAIINGKLTGSGSATVQDQYRATITHEIGHFLGLSHAQNGVHADYATMYPIIETNGQKSLEPDDAAAMSILYPAIGYLSTVGSISGTVKRSNNAILSGVNVVAVDSASGRSYTTVVDYYSGGRTTFSNPPTANGSYTLTGLPPGKYFVQIQPIKSNFTGGSLIASYQNGVSSQSSSIVREWYNGANESGDMLQDNIDEKTGITVTAGGAVTGINFISNESATISTLSYDNGTQSNSYALPTTGGTPWTRYAVRFTAPGNGSLVSVKFRFDGASTLPIGGMLTVAVYTNVSGSLAGIPGTQLGSVTVPFAHLSADQDNEVFLRGLGTAINFNAATDFHVVFIASTGSPRFGYDNGNPTQNRSSYYTVTSGWRNFPQGQTGMTGVNMIASCQYSTQQITGPATVGLSASSLDFGKRRLGVTYDQSVTVTNNGTDPLNVTATNLTGANASEFSIVTGGGTFTLNGGSNRVITMRFTPLTIGAKVATLSIVNNAAGSPHTVALTGTGSQSVSSPIQASYDFGAKPIGSTNNATIALLRNTGNDTLKISSAVMSGPDGATALSLTGGPTAVPPDSVYRASLQFRPTALRTYSATLTLVHDDPGSSPQTFAISGEGNGGQLVIGVTALDFGLVPVGTPRDTMITLRNTGNALLTINDFLITGAASSKFTVTNPLPPFTISPADSMQIQMRFQPTQSGPHTAVLNVRADVGNQQIQLTGNGTVGQLSVPITTVDFGDVKQGDTKADSFQIRNIGQAPLTGVTLSIGGTVFTLDVSAPVTLAPAETRTVHVTLQPQQVVGLQTETASVQSGTTTVPVNIIANIIKKTGGGTGVIEPSVTGGLRLQLGSVQPNPATGGSVQVVCNAQGIGRVPASITVTDVRGRTVAHVFDGYLVGAGAQGSQQFTLDLKGLSNGEYFVVLQSGGGSVAEKFVITR